MKIVEPIKLAEEPLEVGADADGSLLPRAEWVSVADVAGWSDLAGGYQVGRVTLACPPWIDEVPLGRRGQNEQ